MSRVGRAWQRLMDRLTWIAEYVRAATITAARAWLRRTRPPEDKS